MVNCITDRVRLPFLGMFCCSCMLLSCSVTAAAASEPGVMTAAAAVADGYANPKSPHWQIYCSAPKMDCRAESRWLTQKLIKLSFSSVWLCPLLRLWQSACFS